MTPGVQFDGTHSILDIATVIGEDDPDGYATLRKRCLVGTA